MKQISGDINLISFCSGFCFMVLWVQVPVGGGSGNGNGSGSGFHGGFAVCKLGASVVLLFRETKKTFFVVRCYKWFWLVERRHLVLI